MIVSHLNLTVGHVHLSAVCFKWLQAIKAICFVPPSRGIPPPPFSTSLSQEKVLSKLAGSDWDFWLGLGIGSGVAPNPEPSLSGFFGFMPFSKFKSKLLMRSTHYHDCWVIAINVLEWFLVLHHMLQHFFFCFLLCNWHNLPTILYQCSIASVTTGIVITSPSNSCGHHGKIFPLSLFSILLISAKVNCGILGCYVGNTYKKIKLKRGTHICVDSLIKVHFGTKAECRLIIRVVRH